VTPDYYLWMDLETAGTDENVDPILEVAAILTDRRLMDVFWEYSSVVQPESIRWATIPPVVEEMHVASGLKAALDAGRGKSLVEVETTILNLLCEETGGDVVQMAGSGIGHFDRRFIRAQMPLIEVCLDYAVLDIGVVRRFIRDTIGYPIPERPNRHRALADIRDHLQEAREFIELVRLP
jgi:oligoribonuclease